jgi:hypothetical protein
MAAAQPLPAGWSRLAARGTARAQPRNPRKRFSLSAVARAALCLRPLPAHGDAGMVLLTVGLFWLVRQSRNPKIRAKDRWWLVEAALGSTLFIMMLYNNPGFWYAR